MRAIQKAQMDVHSSLQPKDRFTGYMNQPRESIKSMLSNKCVGRQTYHHGITLNHTTCKHEKHYTINIQVCVSVYPIMHVHVDTKIKGLITDE